jgi:cytochrome c
MLRTTAWLLITLISTVLFYSCNSRPGKPRVLVLGKTAGFAHNSVADGMAAIEKLGAENGFDVVTTDEADLINEDSLKNFSAVVFLSTTGDVLNHYQENALERFVQAGGGFVGVHGAADAEYDWGWYGRLVGGYFDEHPGMSDTFPNVQEGILLVKDASHPATANIPAEWKKVDEFYRFKKRNENVKVLLTIDGKSYSNGRYPEESPIAWYHEYDGGRAFYTALGHTKESFEEETFLKHLLGGIQYAIGGNKKLNYSRAKTLPLPDEDRFTKTMLVNGEFFEPTEMTILPNLDILIAQRRGEIMMYKQSDSSLKQVLFLDAYYKANSGANIEEGVLGLQADPNFAANKHVFVFYSPAEKSVNRLSRFTFDKDTLINEKVVLEFFSDREICCHTGGSIAFDSDGLLYLSTGDNSTPFDEPNQPYVNNGYAPLDDRPGHQPYDARRTSGNANDLRGKILRIRVKEDGSYEIPDGNLYPVGTEGTRPEIYVQGNRNPYRISVDKKNGWLYWGEVGPDAGTDSFDVRGPRGYDEVNQARKAGHFGWPYFVANNKPYWEYDYATGKSIQLFDPNKPVNNSRNNTGIKDLPPAQPAFIWYPYAASPEFPQVKTGGRNAMAGPVYYTDMYPKETRLPEYYNGKLIIWDWIRGWVKAVTMLPNGDFDKMEPFLDHIRFNSMIDMEVGPDGKLYFIEYGDGWFTKNPDAGLGRIDYNGGNRAPRIGALQLDKTSGRTPLTVTATIDAKDPENDKMTYTWHLGGGVTRETREPTITHTYEKAGDYEISVEVKDAKNALVKAVPVTIHAGNEAPEVKIRVEGNQQFYFPGTPIKYEVSVTDKDDPNAGSDPADIYVSADFVEGYDKAGANLGHQVVSEVVIGKGLIQGLDCKSCHKDNEKSIGPAYADVAKKYAGRADASNYLIEKILKGGAGVWGEVAMPAHPELSKEDARKIVSYIQSLNAADKAKSLPVKGSLQPGLGKEMKFHTAMVISATYTDKGAPGSKPLSGAANATLRYPTLYLEDATIFKEYGLSRDGGNYYFDIPGKKAWFGVPNVDLTDVKGFQFKLDWMKVPTQEVVFELRLDAPDGKLLGTARLSTNQPPLKKGVNGKGTLTGKFEPVTDGKLHTVYCVTYPDGEGEYSLVAIENIILLNK